MWLDNDSPGCKHDTIDCTACGRCDPSPLERYIDAKEEDEAIRGEIARENERASKGWW